MTEYSRDKAIAEEVGFWRSVLASAVQSADDSRRKAEARTFPPALEALLPGGPPWRVVDVGSGPVSVLGRDPRVEIIQADPLAAEYAGLLKEAGLEAPGTLMAVAGEDLCDGLSAVFGAAAFDLAYSCNALDHTVDPLGVLRQMLAVVRPGYWIVAETYVNEGAGNEYRGLHQWNFCLEGGRAVLWNRAGQRWDVRDALDCTEWGASCGPSLSGLVRPPAITMKGRRPCA